MQVELFAGESSAFGLTSTIRLKTFHDPDDGRTIAVGETVVGNINFHFDIDWYSLRLEEGEAVRISTGAEAQVSSYPTYEWSPIASVQGLWGCLSGVPGLRSLYESQRDRP